MTKASKKSLISWIVTLGLPILILLIPTSVLCHDADGHCNVLF